MSPEYITLGVSIALIGVIFSAMLIYTKWNALQRYETLERHSRHMLQAAERRRVLMEQDVLRCNAHLLRIAEILQGSSQELGEERAPAVAQLQASMGRIATNARDITGLDESARTLRDTMVFLEELCSAYEIYLREAITADIAVEGAA